MQLWAEKVHRYVGLFLLGPALSEFAFDLVECFLLLIEGLLALVESRLPLFRGYWRRSKVASK